MIGQKAKPARHKLRAKQRASGAEAPGDFDALSEFGLYGFWVYLTKRRQLMEAQSFDLIEEFHSEDIMSVNHSKLIHRLSVALDRYEAQYDILPELELELTTGKCKPDVSVFNTLSVDWLNDVIFYTKPPIIAVEILSPKQALTELTDKAYKQYFPAGVQSVWLIIPVLQIIHILLPDGSRQVFAEGVLHDSASGIDVDLGYLFK